MILKNKSLNIYFGFYFRKNESQLITNFRNYQNLFQISVLKGSSTKKAHKRN